MNHYTDSTGAKAIGSQPDWVFKAYQPPGDHPFGAFFTTLAPNAPNLSARLGIPRERLTFLFEFTDRGDLIQLRGGRGKYVLYSPTDYTVTKDRQVSKGATGL
jgi:hypothetical protein